MAPKSLKTMKSTKKFARATLKKPAHAPTKAMKTTNRPQVTVCEWNTYLGNHNADQISDVLSKVNADVYGLPEFSSRIDVDWFVKQLGWKTHGCVHQMQDTWPGEIGCRYWIGFGCTFVINTTNVVMVEGGKRMIDGGNIVHKVDTRGPQYSMGGYRAVNHVVLREKRSGKVFIVAGIHLSANGGGGSDKHIEWKKFKELQQSELKALFTIVQDLKAKYADAPVILMGDLNTSPDGSIVKALTKGKVGGMYSTALDDMAQVKKAQRTFYSRAGAVIDYIFAENGRFDHIEGGRAWEGLGGGKWAYLGQDGKWLNGADHYPIYAKVSIR